MAEIIQFPKTTLKHRLEETLSDMRESLSEMYAALEKVDQGYKSIENQTHEMEDSYQELMMAYVDEVGSDNVPLEWLEYCPYVGMERGEDGKITITLIKPPEKK
tara:strand:+ start:19877 stop:20188 length:312 start_codon:yes stop_codon:yes gene_type:complete